MSDEQVERWMDKIRSLAEPIRNAEYQIHKTDALIKKTLAQSKLKAFGEGHKTIASQEVYAENNPDLYKLRLELAVSKSNLSSLKVKLESYKIGFEEWRTEMVNAREEARRYNV